MFLKKTLFFIIITVGFSIILISCFFVCDKCFLLTPLPREIPFEIRVDSYGNGYFGTHRGGGRRHNGIDLTAPVNTAVLAAKSGIVMMTDTGKGAGNYIIIWHWPNLKSYYMHLSEIKVEKWQPVRQGQIIGKVGKTGNANYKSMTPHLHFEIREYDAPQDILKRWRLGMVDNVYSAQKQEKSC